MCKPNTAICRTFCSEIHGIFGYIANFGVNIRSNCLHNFPTSSLLHSSQSRPESDRNSRWPNSNSSLPNSIYPFKILTDETRIWIWPPRILSDSGRDWLEWRREEVGKLWRQLDLIFTPKFAIYPKIPWISEQNVLQMAVFGLHIRLPQYFN